MPAPLFAALIHYPIRDKHDCVVSTAITNLDIHDIARSARTYGIQRYFIVTPLAPQQWLARRIMKHWDEGWGAEYNPNRKDALGIVDVVADIGAVAAAVTEMCEISPVWVATSAKHYPNSISYGALRDRMQTDSKTPICLMFGTGWGLHPDLILEADFMLEPISGPTEYNHLSVRAAAAIIFDRLCAPVHPKQNEG
jgi:hypothetical protein